MFLPKLARTTDEENKRKRNRCFWQNQIKEDIEKKCISVLLKRIFVAGDKTLFSKSYVSDLRRMKRRICIRFTDANILVRFEQKAIECWRVEFSRCSVTLLEYVHIAFSFMLQSKIILWRIKQFFPVTPFLAAPYFLPFIVSFSSLLYCPVKKLAHRTWC